MEPIAVSVSEACKLSGLGRTSLYRLIKSRQIAVTKIGARTLVQVPSLRRLLLDPPDAAPPDVAP
jgi:excisionase family DNA binding protein